MEDGVGGQKVWLIVGIYKVKMGEEEAAVPSPELRCLLLQALYVFW